MTKIATGLNDAPKDTTIGQPGPSLPDDSDQPIEATEEEALQIRAKLERMADENAKADADDFIKQITRPKHGTGWCQGRFPRSAYSLTISTNTAIRFGRGKP
ncbi:hypothetical protein [Rhizobium sp. F40D2]|uniref:hypothetical protein n=1 Tax=Rhizobium sp. F40D2 TaxID=3453141 RepID=UPI003F20D21E